ncbi:MAG: hypothetical protein VKJ64_08405 [Leptolyngbyaceae bacterium]|nr:hypothetical protein [Leptolyngbyaceae bacterium]
MDVYATSRGRSLYHPLAGLSRSMCGITATVMMVGIAGCSNLLTNDYRATAVTTYVWQVEYTGESDRPYDRRIQRFASTSLENVDGIMPDAAVGNADDQGLWWPALPPRPTVDELEAGQKRGERIGTPEIIKQVDYTLSFYQDGQQQTLPANYSVYRQAVKAIEDDRPLELTLGPAEQSVQKAEIR